MADSRTTAARLTAQLRDAFGVELQSVVVFGSVARGEAIPGVSDLNLLVLLSSLSPPILVRAAPLLLQWMLQGNTPPYMFSTEEWSGMQDTFALEIADMIDAREVLWGYDPITTESVSYEALRLQSERETRDTLLHLRLRLVVNAKSPSELGSLLLSGFPSFAAYMRAALRLSGEMPSLDSRQVVERIAQIMHVDPAPMLTCLEARQARRPLEIRLTDPLVENYLGFVRSLLQHLNQMPTERPAPHETPRYFPSAALRPTDPKGRASVQP